MKNYKRLNSHITNTFTVLLLFVLLGFDYYSSAQPFTVNTSYKFPSTYNSGYSGYTFTKTSLSDRNVVDVHGDYGNGYQYQVGAITTGGPGVSDIYIYTKNASTGAAVDSQIIDVQPSLTINPGTSDDDLPTRITVDEANDLLYIIGNSTNAGVTFLLCYDISTPSAPSLSWGFNLPVANTPSYGADVAVDANFNVFAVTFDSYLNQFEIFKYDMTGNSGTPITSFSSNSLSSYSVFQGLRIKIDDANNYLYIVGTASNIPGGGGINNGFIALFDRNLNYSTTVFHHDVSGSTKPANANYYCIDIDPTNGNQVAVLGIDWNTGHMTWNVWNPGFSGGVPIQVGVSTANGVSTDSEIPQELLIDPTNGNYIVLFIWVPTVGNVFNFVSYINQGFTWDVYYGTSMYGFNQGSGLSGKEARCMNKNSNGKILVGGIDYVVNSTSYAFTALLNNPACTSWGNYENKQGTAVNNMHEANGKFSVYPNPATDKVTIQLADKIDGTATLSIIDITGKVLRSIEITGMKMEVNVATLPSGMYLLKYTDRSRTEITKLNKE